MSARRSEAKVVDIVRCHEMPVTETTLKWFEALYASGAIIYEPDGSVSLDAKVREAIAAMHQVLAGGEVRFEIARRGDETFERLEAMFDRALAEATTANETREGEEEVLPYMP